MKRSVITVLKQAIEDEKLRQERAAKTNRNSINEMSKEEDRHYMTWNDCTGMMRLFETFDFIPYTECWVCEETCKCGLVGSVWMIQMDRIFKNGRLYHY